MGKSGNPAKRAAEERAQAAKHRGSAATRATFYCDESGNTGVHWGDPDQPVFVHGGWMIPETKKDALLATIPDLRQRHRLNAPELKWQHFAKRDGGAAIFRDFFDTILAHGAMPFFQVMDKDYILAAKATETFFDPAYNQFLPVEFTSAFDIKKELADNLSHASEELADFGDMLRAGVPPEPARLDELAHRFAAFMERNNGPALAEMLRHFDAAALDAMGSEFGAAVWMRTTLGHSMFALMNRLEHFLRPRNVRIDIVHDNIVRFDELLGMVRGMFRESNGRDTLIINGEARYFSMPTVDGMRLGDSKDEPFIQLADLLCGFVRTVFTKIKFDDSLSADERAVCGDLVALHADYYTWDVNVPEKTLATLSTVGWTELRERFTP